MIILFILAYSLFLIIEGITCYKKIARGKEANGFLLPPIIGYAFIHGMIINQDVSLNEISIMIWAYAVLYGIYWLISTCVFERKNKVNTLNKRGKK